jgi:hypothetical protein
LLIFPTSPTDWKLLLKEEFVIHMLMTKYPKGDELVTSKSAVSCEFQLIPHPSLLTPCASAGIESLSDVTSV